MMNPRPRHFDECFPAWIRGDANFVQYLELVDTHSSPKPSQATPEKHHIVPREWLSWRVEGFSFDAEDVDNVVYLSVRNKIIAMERLVLLFLDMHDSTTYKSLTESFARRYHLGWFGFWKSPYLERGMVTFLAEKRKQELKERKRKYSDEFLLRCRGIMEAGGWTDEAFSRVKAETGFEFTRRALEDQLRKRFKKVR